MDGDLVEFQVQIIFGKQWLGLVSLYLLVHIQVIIMIN